MVDKSILIVDDNKDLVDSITIMLEFEGYTSTVAYNGTDAITLLREQQFDICLYDIQLPDINGVELIQSTFAEQLQARIIFMTGYRIEQLLCSVNDNVTVLRHLPEETKLTQVLADAQNGGIVLLADDNEETAQRLLATLKKQGRQFVSLSSKDDLPLDDNIDTIIINLPKPVTCSLELHLRLQQHKKELSAIIIAPVALAKEDIDPLRSLSVTGCLFKPFETLQLLTALASAGSSTGDTNQAGGLLT